VGTVGVMFAPLAPLLPVGACLVLCVFYWVQKHQLMYRYGQGVETGGVGSSPSSIVIVQSLKH
jgi:hypothetical protein